MEQKSNLVKENKNKKDFDKTNKSKSFLPNKIEKNNSDNTNILNNSDNKINKDKKNSTNRKKEKVFVEKIKSKINESVKETKQIIQENKEELNPNVNKKLEEAQFNVKKSSSKIKVYFYALCLLVNLVCFSFILILLSSSAINVKHVLDNGSVAWFVVTIFSFLVCILLDSLLFNILLKRSSKKSNFILSFKSVSVGRYYDCLTPLKTGGQPFQIAYLHRFGENGKTSASVPVSRFVINQFVYLIAIVVLLFNVSKIEFMGDTTFSSIVSITAYVGLGIQIIWLLTLAMLSYTKRMGPALVIGSLKILAKLKIIKNYRLAYVKVLRFVKEYQITMRRCLSNMWQFMLILLISAINMIIKWSIPFLIYSSFCGFDFSLFFTMFAYSMLMELALGFWILPGNVVFADLVFLAFFRPLFGGSLIFWALLLWRILSYYAYIVFGAFVKLYDIAKYNWAKKSYIKQNKEATNLPKKKQNNK